jgi:hypothetical protein
MDVTLGMDAGSAQKSAFMQAGCPSCAVLGLAVEAGGERCVWRGGWEAWLVNDLVRG